MSLLHSEKSTKQVAALVIETLALSEAELLDRIVDLELDNRTLRETLHAAVEGLHHVTTERDRLRLRVRELADQIRVLWHAGQAAA